MSKASITASNIRLRKSFGRVAHAVDVPNLIELQKYSYENFLQKDVDPDKRQNIGLQSVFKSIFPIEDYKGVVRMEFVKYTLQYPVYDIDECRQRKISYAAPLRVLLRLIVFDVQESTGEKTIRDVKEQEVFLGEVPLMTDSGSFIINGTERVIVSQLHRSPGVFFDHDGGRSNTTGKLIYSARIIPYRGSWLDFEFDHKDLIYARIDRRRKFPATIFLKALNYTEEEILEYFYDLSLVSVSSDGKIFRPIDIEKMAGQRASSDIKNTKGDVIVKAGRRITRMVIKKVLSANVKKVELTPADLNGTVIAKPVFNSKTGEIIADTNQAMTEEIFEEARANGISQFHLIFFDGFTVGAYLCNTLLLDKVSNKEEALLDIYKRMRPGEPPTIEAAENFFNRLFFHLETYDLGKVGRLKMNHRFNISASSKKKGSGVLNNTDILNVLRTLIDLKNGKGQVDDIDHLGNRRVRSVGELVENQYRIGLVRMERVIRERMSMKDLDTMMPHDLINAKSVSAVIKEFFGSSQLSQFMDQTNPLSEITHKRRLSALGPGGLTRDRAGFEVRDVHPTHYGRICPIETPEGPNIGLIASLATFARINKYGFIETPYCEVKGNKVTDKVNYISALEEQKHCIAQADPYFKDVPKGQNVTVRMDGEYKVVKKEEVSLMDVSPSQLVSIASSLIPFLEHDDANRALMGSNMQRQAVPLMRASAPLVGTGVEGLVARDSVTSVVCKADGVVEEVDASRIVVRLFHKSGKLGASVDIYNLVKYQKTNQNTCFNQKPIVQLGDRIRKGDVIADGPSTDKGELALGQNILVAFTPWAGYNFEDSILISERLIKEDVYTSIHIEEFECVARDTKLGQEEITSDIANVGGEALKDLDNSGIICIGAKVKPGDILVGKITPKGESQVSPEKKLLLAIFGEKAGEVRDTSLRAPSGVYGTVINTQIYSRDPMDKNERLAEILHEKREKLKKDFEIEKNVIQNNTIDQIREILVGAKTVDVLLSDDGSEELLPKGHIIESSDVDKIPFPLLAYIPLKEDAVTEAVSQLVESARNRLSAVEMVFQDRVERLSKGDEMPPGVIKMVKVYVAVKRKLKVGDKFAGRHGNKGVISHVLPEESMPYMADGTPVDMVLNPLGVPSRMNIGQILETHLGWAAYALGRQLQDYIDHFNADRTKAALLDFYKGNKDITNRIEKGDETSLKKMVRGMKEGVFIATPVFDGAKEKDVKDLLTATDLPHSGQTVLFDGRTGEPFQRPVTVGVMYMLKLHHLVEEKIHSRSIGPYSLVSQQPLGGKAQFGGQRLGEMEVWAIEAYGAAYCLQEFLTVKSDDVAGRRRMYESIVKGENILEPGIPESFNVLIKELQSLGLNVEMIESEFLTEAPKTGGKKEPALEN
ncbi:MAG: DNA-directed RNA polymerase subunit beta [Bdellovibrionales bacterium]|nr:DNA-directed RNA polymerase subunit beta [Bdellovibrionales bacterium]